MVGCIVKFSVEVKDSCSNNTPAHDPGTLFRIQDACGGSSPSPRLPPPPRFQDAGEGDISSESSCKRVPTLG